MASEDKRQEEEAVMARQLRADRNAGRKKAGKADKEINIKVTVRKKSNSVQEDANPPESKDIKEQPPKSEEEGDKDIKEQPPKSEEEGDKEGKEAGYSANKQAGGPEGKPVAQPAAGGPAAGGAENKMPPPSPEVDSRLGGGIKGDKSGPPKSEEEKQRDKEEAQRDNEEWAKDPQAYADRDSEQSQKNKEERDANKQAGAPSPETRKQLDELDPKKEAGGAGQKPAAGQGPEPTLPVSSPEKSGESKEGGEDKAERESGFSRELRSEKSSRERLQGRQKRLGKEKSQKAKKKGGKLASRMAKAAQNDSDWPFVLAIILSGINDIVDICDGSLGFGLDQLFDFTIATGIFATRAFIRKQPGWWTIRIIVFILELIPGVGILPIWTMAAIHSWQKAKKLRQQGIFERATQEVIAEDIAEMAEQGEEEPEEQEEEEEE